MLNVEFYPQIVKYRRFRLVSHQFKASVVEDLWLRINSKLSSWRITDAQKQTWRSKITIKDNQLLVGQKCWLRGIFLYESDFSDIKLKSSWWKYL